MVSILQRVLDASQSNGYKDEEFYAHLALAKKLPSSNHFDLALKSPPQYFRLDKFIPHIFEYAACSYETVLPLIRECETAKYRARAYCILATHFPDKKKECLDNAFKDADKNDEVYHQIARTFQNVKAANSIRKYHEKAIVLLEMCLECLEADPKKADSLFRQAMLTNEAGWQICDLLRAIALKAALLKRGEAPYYTQNYLSRLAQEGIKIQSRHCKQLFKELVDKDRAAAVSAAKSAKKMPTIAAQGALIIAEAATTDIMTFTAMVDLAKKSLKTLDKSSFKNHASIRLAMLLKSDSFPKEVDKDLVTTARWIHALYSNGRKRKVIPYIKSFPSQVKTYLKSITTASSDQYRERRDTLLKAALKLIKYFPDIALELVRLALPTLANDRLYIEHLKTVVTFAAKQTPSIQERIIAQIGNVLTQHRKLHNDRSDNVRLFIDLAKTVHPLSGTLALQLIAQARKVKPMWKPEEIAELDSCSAFQQVQLELYEQALAKDPDNIKLIIDTARLSPSEKKEELLGKALDTALSNKGSNTHNYLQAIINNFL